MHFVCLSNKFRTPAVKNSFEWLCDQWHHFHGVFVSVEPLASELHMRRHIPGCLTKKIACADCTQLWPLRYWHLCTVVRSSSFSWQSEVCLWVEQGLTLHSLVFCLTSSQQSDKHCRGALQHRRKGATGSRSPSGCDCRRIGRETPPAPCWPHGSRWVLTQQYRRRACVYVPGRVKM